MNDYTMKTPRLGLRLLSVEDLDLLDPLESDPDVKRYFPSGTRDRAKTEEMIKRFISNFHEQQLPCFLLFDIPSSEFVGRAGFGVTEAGEVEIGYVLHKKFWGRGYASEAVTLLLDYARQYIDVEYIIAYADVDNIASTRMMEKCGMTYYKTDVAHGVSCRFYRIRNR